MSELVASALAGRVLEPGWIMWQSNYGEEYVAFEVTGACWG